MAEIDDRYVQLLVRHIKYADNRIARHEADVVRVPKILSAEKELATAREIKGLLVKAKNEFMNMNIKQDVYHETRVHLQA